MRVIHFTAGATDSLETFDSVGVSFLRLADGQGNTHISCLHLERNAKVSSPSLTHACLLLCVHGRLTLTTQLPQSQIDIHAGMGAVIEKNEPYSLRSEEGAILLIVESERLLPSDRAISTPQRIEGATWPSDTLWLHAAKKYSSTRRHFDT